MSEQQNQQERDANCDLAVCMTAAPGPWRMTEDRAVNLEGDSVWAVVDAAGQLLFLDDRPAEIASSNLVLAAMAREAIPEWIGRALNAEAENLRLRAQIEGHCQRIAAQSDALSRAAEKVEVHVRELREENAGLRADGEALAFAEDLAAWQAGEISEGMVASMHGLDITDLRELLHQVKELARLRWQAWRAKNPPVVPGKEVGG